MIKRAGLLVLGAAVAWLAFTFTTTDEISHKRKNIEAWAYTFEMSGSSKTRLSRGAQALIIDGRHALSGQLELRPIDDASVAMTITQLNKAVVEVLGENALDGRGIEGQTFLVSTTELQAPASATLDHTRLAKLIAVEIQADIRPESSWTAVEPALLGEVESRYERAEQQVTRIRGAYLSLKGRTADSPVKVSGRDAIQLDGSRILSLEGTEEVSSAGFSARLSRELRRVDVKAHRPRAPLAAMTPYPLSKPIVTETIEERAMAQRIGGLTPDQMIADLAAHPNGRLPNHNEWLWRASGLVKSQPQVSKRLLNSLNDDRLTTSGRGLILDLLVSGGHAEAQSALRDAMALESLQADPEHSILFQRLALLKKPNIETVRFLEEQRAKTDSLGVYTAATVSLGAAAARVDDGEVIARTLVNDLTRETDAGRQRALLAAIGNSEYAPAVSELAQKLPDWSPNLRAAAASALRRMKGQQARDLALSLAHDSVDLVQVRAINALRKHPLTEADLGRFDVTELSELALPALVTLLEPYAEIATARQVLASVLTRPADPSLKARVRSILGTP